MPADYRDAILTCVYAAQFLQGFDIPDILRSIDHADSIGPILDPTAWIRNQKAMHEDEAIFKAALPLWEIGQKLARGRSENSQEVT